MKVIWGLDVEQIQGYLFSVNRLREIRNASHLLEAEVCQAGARAITGIGGRLVMAAAGNLQAVVDDRQVPDLEQSLAATLRARLPRLSYVTATVPLDGGGLKGALAGLASELAGKKTGHDPAPAFPHAGVMEYCQVCGCFPVTRIGKGPDGSDEGQCADCAARGKRPANGGLAGLEDRLLEQAKTLHGAQLRWAVPENIVEMVCGWKGAKEEDVERLGPRARYMALIVADANRMGEKYQRADYGKGTLEQQVERAWQCSEAIKECLWGSLAAALGSINWAPLNPPESEAERCLPVMPLFVAGDDIVLLCRAALGVPFAGNLVKQFAAKSRGSSGITDVLGKGGLALSAGVAIAHHKFPLHRLRDLAEELCDEAKAAADEARPEECGALSFLRVTSSMVGSLGQTRKDQDIILGDAITLRPSACPYVVPVGSSPPQGRQSLDTLLHALDLVRNATPENRVPARRLHRAREWLRLEGDLRLHTREEELARLAPGPRKTWNEVIKTLGCDQDGLVPGKAPIGFLCPLVDLAELEACDE